MKWGNPASEFVRQRAIDVMVDVTRAMTSTASTSTIISILIPNLRGQNLRSIRRLRLLPGLQVQGRQARTARLAPRQHQPLRPHRLRRGEVGEEPCRIRDHPFGIWRPGNPSSVKAGLDAYDDICADSRLWFNQGWLDYLSPQLYWRIDSDQNYASLYQWWSGENKQRRHLFPGIASSRILSSDDRGRPATETIRQIDVTRQKPSPAVPATFTGASRPSRTTAAVSRANCARPMPRRDSPASPWLGSGSPAPVFVAPSQTKDGLHLTFKPEPSARWRVLQVREGNQWTTLRMLPSAQETVQLEGTPEAVAIRHIGPTGLLSIPTVLARQ